jgi:hypothetical protein
VAFVLLALQRTLLEMSWDSPPFELAFYGLRAFAYLVLAAGIVDKNRRAP